MRLTIFSRLLIGYFITIILVLAISLYAIRQIGKFNQITQSVLKTDNQIIDYSDRLKDSLLSQIRFDKKFIITKDNALHDQYLLFKSDIDLYLRELTLITDSDQSRQLLKSVIDDYQLYQEVFNEEVELIKAGKKYSEGWYAQEKDAATDKIISQLQGLRSHGQQNTYHKINKLDKAGLNARKMFLMVAAVFLFLGISISLLINSSITHPISVLKKKTTEIAKGNFEGNLNLHSPPEIGQLAEAFNFMCNKLKDLDKMKSDFFSSMSHELRTPLTSIKEGSGILLEGIAGELTEKQRKLLTILSEESNRLIELVNSLLDLSKMEAGMMTYVFEKANLAPLIERTMIEIAPLLEAKKIHLESSVSKELPAIDMDSERILQALRNLIGNAVKFTPEGGRVWVSCQPAAQGVEVSIKDSGPGIPEKNLIMIFDKFQQANLTGSYRLKGTGLGLAIVKHIITSHGGEIWAKSKPEQGSTFIFTLPV